MSTIKADWTIPGTGIITDPDYVTEYVVKPLLDRGVKYIRFMGSDDGDDTLILMEGYMHDDSGRSLYSAFYRSRFARSLFKDELKPPDGTSDVYVNLVRWLTKNATE